MKRFLKRNLLPILSFLILISWGTYWVKRWFVSSNTSDPVIFFYQTICDNMSLLMIIAPLFVIIPATYNFHKELHSGYIKNCLTRTSYNKYMKKLYLSSLAKSMILPLFVIILFMLCCLKTGNLDFGSGVEYYNYYTSPPKWCASIIGTFMFVYLIGIILNSIFYMHLGIIFAKKNSNFLVAVILAFIAFIGADIIGEGLIGGILLARVLDIHNVQDLLSLFNVWCYDGVKNLGLCILYYVSLVAISGGIIYFRYRNKEAVIVETEK